MKISRNSLILGLSYALDIFGMANCSHSKSTAYLSVMVARELGYSPEKTQDVYYAALLHDIGLGCYESEKFYVYEIDIKKHCDVGAKMLSDLPLPACIAESVLYHHEFIDGSGPYGLKDSEIPRDAKIVALTDAFDDVFSRVEGPFNRKLFLEIKSWLHNTRSLYASDVTSAFERLSDKEFFLLDYFNKETKYTLTQSMQIEDDSYYGTDDVEAFARCFAEVIDQRSPFTYKHSTGIANLARKAVTELGYSEEVRSKMFIAGLLHDIGKMHVSAEILHKPGPLSPDERFEMNKHTYYTRKILEQIEGLGDIVDIAANHHERIDGGGYPFKKKGHEISELDRIMSICDVYQALTEERPYRKSLPKEKVWEIISGMADRKQLDKGLVEKMKMVF